MLHLQRDDLHKWLLLEFQRTPIFPQIFPVLVDVEQSLEGMLGEDVENWQG